MNAPPDGYIVPASGIINLHDRNGAKMKPPFNVGKGSLEEEAAKLELHMHKCLQQNGEWMLLSNLILCAIFLLVLPCSVLLSC